MLVDLARNDLGRVATPGSVKVEPYRVIERYSHVIHLVSGVRGVLEPGADAFDLFAAAFPAGTVVGAPKIRALELLRELEPVPRGQYAGTVGYFGHGGAMDQAIAIRTLRNEWRRADSQVESSGAPSSSMPSSRSPRKSSSAALRRSLAAAETPGATARSISRVSRSTSDRSSPTSALPLATTRARSVSSTSARSLLRHQRSSPRGSLGPSQSRSQRRVRDWGVPSRAR